ncbi:MAG: hypothetical protein GTN43_04435 [Candidatus Aenigmarchaeota archaeon]|nr:hypothetical protein [Candidatus Aenigmarchaeota archaeon]
MAFLLAGIVVLAGPAVPSVSNMTLTDPVDLNACSTVVIWCNATITDDDGWYNEVDTVNATLWDEAAVNEGDSDDNSNHYTNLSCALGENISATDVFVNCSFTLQYYANPANWTCKIRVNDSSSNVGSNSTNLTVNTLIALDAEDTMNFGSLDPGVTSPDDVNNTVTNCGNVAIDLNLSGTDLTNTSATVTNITVGSIKYNVTNYSQDYATGMTSLSATSTRADFNLGKRTNGAMTNKTYWKISIPSVIENLIYTGTVTFTAVTDS